MESMFLCTLTDRLHRERVGSMCGPASRLNLMSGLSKEGEGIRAWLDTGEWRTKTVTVQKQKYALLSDLQLMKM